MDAPPGTLGQSSLLPERSEGNHGMSLRFTLELTDKDLDHFRAMARKAMETARQLSPEEVIEAGRKMLAEVKEKVESDFIRERLNQLAILIEMLEDTGWGMKEIGRKRVLTGLAYFVNPEDLIPDHLPGIGFLDDAIMVELICRELKPEIDAYRDFVKYRTAEAGRLGVDPAKFDRSDYLETRHKELLSRMRRRRRRGHGGGGGPRSPFSLF